MSDMCDDNRFELIEKYKKKLIESTNIETRPEEMKVLDSILFRFWQMGWLDKLELPSAEPQWISCNERLPEYGVSVLTYDGNCYCVEKRIPYICCDDHGEHLISDWWVSDDYDEADSDYYPNLRDGACIAWMPLPEPWKGEQHERSD